MLVHLEELSRWIRDSAKIEWEEVKLVGERDCGSRAVELATSFREKEVMWGVIIRDSNSVA